MKKDEKFPTFMILGTTIPVFIGTLILVVAYSRPNEFFNKASSFFILLALQMFVVILTTTIWARHCFYKPDEWWQSKSRIKENNEENI